MLGAIGLLVMGVFVWPTPWRQEFHPSGRYRVNRFTGTRQVEVGGAWTAVPNNVAPDPEIDAP